MSVAGIFQQQKKSIVCILSDKEEAAYFQNDLQHFFPKKEILFFPDSFRKPGKLADELNTSNIQLRTEALNRWTNSPTHHEILVSYPEAIFEKVVETETLKNNTIRLRLHERFDTDKAIASFTEAGFDYVDFVYEPGQFAVRGGIVDIFSFGNELPYRIELSGEDIESIRIFDPLTQLSERRIAEISIVPDLQSKSANGKISFFDFISGDTIIFIKDTKLTDQKLNDLFDQATEIHKQLQQIKTHPVREEKNYEQELQLWQTEPQAVFLDGKLFLQQLKKFPLVEMYSSYFQSDDVFSFDLSPQPSFNKNFNLLIEDWRKYESKAYSNLLFSDNAKQVERFHNIFHDLKADVQFHSVGVSLSSGFIDHEQKLVCYTDHQIFERYHRFHLKEGFSKSRSLTVKMLRELRPGDYVTHIDHGVGIFSGLEKIEVNGQIQEAVRLVYRDSDLLYVSIQSLHKITKYVGKDGTPPRVNKLGSDAWENLKRKTKSKVKDIAKDLIQLYAKRKAQHGFAFSPDNYMQTELEASFIYEDTPDQIKSTQDLKRDMEKNFPMDRLICGDVGFGKTEVAIRAAFKAVLDGKQVAVLVPTTILTLQHFKTFSDRLSEFPVTVDYLNRFKSAKKQKETLQKLAQGKIDILIGTSAILGSRVKWKDQGLLIIDEEQKFGVAAKEKLRQLRVNIDTLTLTATPIPRTLQFSLMGARDLSIMNTPPPNRQPIETEHAQFDAEMIKEAIEFEVYRGGQVFFIHNRVKDIGQIAGLILKVCPNVDVAVAHGQMEDHLLEEKIMGFIERKYDVLVCTNIVEAGLDIPNANTIIINEAQNFGLSDLHQLRGRVGRSNKKAFCYLLTPPFSLLSSDARKRLQTLEEFSDLGSGFHIAMRDLDIRGAGNLLGAEQSGFIADIGYDTYHKILDEAIRELKETDFRDLFAEELQRKTEFIKDCTIDTDLEMHIPDEYVTNINERLALYSELDNLETEEELRQFENRMHDRFGPLPQQVKELFNGVRLRNLARQLGFEKMILKNGQMRAYFISNADSPYYNSEIFNSVIAFITSHPKNCSFRQTEKSFYIIVNGIHSIEEAKSFLTKLTESVKPVEA